MTSLYKYERLKEDHIRIIKLLPPTTSSEIRIQLSQVSVGEISRPDYEALSYRWIGQCGPDIEVVSSLSTQATHIDPSAARRGRRARQDRESEAESSRRCVLKVTRNLKSALIHLRQQNTARALWIDAICVNQEDKDEKDQEIPKMGSIYARAKRVILWLGDSTPNTEKAFQAFADLGHRIQWNATEAQWEPAHTSNRGLKWFQNRRWKGMTEDEFDVPFKPKTWSAIDEVLLSECFRRVWIWQEICLAAGKAPDSVILRCGVHQLYWQTFFNAVLFFLAEPDISGAKGDQERFAAHLKPVANMAGLPAIRNLLDLLILTRRCDCGYPSDRIYGVRDAFHEKADLPPADSVVLGLATRREGRESALLACVKPDHEKSCNQVYRDFAVGELQTMRRLNVLWNCDAEAWTDEHALPSWVPNWRVCLPYSSLDLGIFGGGQGEVPLSIVGNSLKLKGVHCDEVIGECSESGSNSLKMQHMASIIHRWYMMRFGRFSLSEEVLVALCHVLTLGHLESRYPEERWPVDLQHAKDVISDMLFQGKPPREKARIIPHMMHVFPGRKLFITKTGRIGLGPAQSQSGDRVVSVIGSKHLMLLRAVSPAPLESFKIIGICYVHGLMNLETILGQLPEGSSVRLVPPFGDTWNMRFFCNGLFSPLDPRLPDGHDGWVSRQASEDRSLLWCPTGREKWVRNDPRHIDVEFLIRRGVVVRDIEIV